MEIHAPDHPPSTWKETGKHLAIITAGVLIALTLEGVVSWVDHRMLVREAVANLNAELRNNKKELDGLFANLKKEQKQLEHADEVGGVLLAHKPISTLELELESHGAELRNAAVTTGQITRSVRFHGLRRRAAVRRHIRSTGAVHASAGTRKSAFSRCVGRFVRRIASADRPADDAIQRWRAQIDVALVGVVDREQLGRQLQKRYDETLAGR